MCNASVIFIKFISRLFLWLKVLKTFRGLTFHSEINLWLSAFIDTLLYTFSSKKFNPRLVFGGLLLYKVKGLGTVIVRGRTDDFYYLIPGREWDVEVFVRSCLKNGSIFVNVGANVGYYTLIASKLVEPLGHVYAIEPVPSTAGLLKANVKLNGCNNVVVYEAAAWSFKGKMILNIPKSFYGYASLVRGGEEKLIIKTITLDEILRDVNSIDLIKIDVEGAEHEVLIGAEKSLDKIKYMVIELSCNVRDNVREVLRFLIQHGFKVKKLKFTTYILAYRG